MSPSAMQDHYPYQNEPTWSTLEMVIARRVFDAALSRELPEIIQKTKQKATQVREPADVCELERYLTRRREEIDRKYEFRFFSADAPRPQLEVGILSAICLQKP